MLILFVGAHHWSNIIDQWYYGSKYDFAAIVL